MMIARVWRKHGLKPHRLDRYMTTNDPDFETLYAAFNTKTGEVLGKTAARHTSAEFVAFLSDLVANQPRRKAIHVIADNLSAHKTKRVEAFLDAHPNVKLHFTPTYSS